MTAPITHVIKTYEDFAEHGDYLPAASVGTWPARLDFTAWGKNGNLLLYFTHAEEGTRHRISVFWNTGYRPRKSGESFRDQPLGSVFKLTTRLSSGLWPDLVNAEPINDPGRDWQSNSEAVTENNPSQ